MKYQNLYTYLNMAAVILIWISTVDDGHMTKLVTIATIHNIGHLEKKTNTYYIQLPFLDIRRMKRVLKDMQETKAQISLRIRAICSGSSLLVLFGSLLCCKFIG